jgi:hypothetical protein
VLYQKYTTFQLIRELKFRAGIILFGIAGGSGGQNRAECRRLWMRHEELQSTRGRRRAAKKKEKATLRQIECRDCGKKLAPGLRFATLRFRFEHAESI